MELYDVLQVGGTSAVILLLTIIKIPKLEVNVWGLIGRALNKEQRNQIETMQKSVNEIATTLDKHISDEAEYRAEQARQFILVANDELMRHIRHSKEWFDDLLSKIDFYEDYCAEHPEYANNKAVLAIQNIKVIYQAQLETNDFL